MIAIIAFIDSQLIDFFYNLNYFGVRSAKCEEKISRRMFLSNSNSIQQRINWVKYDWLKWCNKISHECAHGYKHNAQKLVLIRDRMLSVVAYVYNP